MSTGNGTFLCILCETEYRHGDGLRRHYLAAHRLIWQHGSLSGATEGELTARLEALRRRQMSSRRRRRYRASRLASGEGTTGEFSEFRVAAVRTADAVEVPDLWGLEHQARHILHSVSRITDNPETGPAQSSGLRSYLHEQSNRHY